MHEEWQSGQQPLRVGDRNRYAALTWQFMVNANDFPPLGSSTVTAMAPSDGLIVVVGNQGRPCRTTIRSPSGSPSGVNSDEAVPNTGSPNAFCRLAIAAGTSGTARPISLIRNKSALLNRPDDDAARSCRAISSSKIPSGPA